MSRCSRECLAWTNGTYGNWSIRCRSRYEHAQGCCCGSSTTDPEYDVSGFDWRNDTWRSHDSIRQFLANGCWRSWWNVGSSRILAIANFKQRGWRWIRIFRIRHNANAWWHVAWLLSHVPSWILANIAFRSHFTWILAYFTVPGSWWIRSYFTSLFAYITHVLAYISSILSCITRILANLAELLARIPRLWWSKGCWWTTILARIACLLSYESVCRCYIAAI